MKSSATMVIWGATIIPMTPSQNCSNAEALAIEGDRITTVGSNKEIEPLIGERTRVLDLAGKTIVPGFIDTHVHFVNTGLGLRGPNLYDCTTVDQVLERVRGEVKGQDKGVPIFFFRCRLGLLNKQLTRYDLDRVAPENPVGIGDFGLHACVVNSRALRILNLSPKMLGITTDPGIAQPTGLLTEHAHTVARSYFYNALDDSVRLQALQLASQAALQVGVTTVHAIEGRDAFSDRDARAIINQRENLPIRFVLYHQSTTVKKAQEVNAQGITDMWADGSYADHSAALLEPYADDPGASGKLYFTQDQLNDFVWTAHRAGLQVGLHAIGDAAIEQVLNAYERANRLDADFVKRRHRIEHFSLPTDAQIERAQKLGVGVAMQPILSAGGDAMLNQQLGIERATRRHPYRKIVDAGLLVAGGSDSDFAPMDPLAGIHAVVNNPIDSRRLDVREALALFTTNASVIAHEEEVKGSIEPGKLADLVVLGDNPFTTPPAKLKDIPVEMTIVGGKIQYEKKEQPC